MNHRRAQRLFADHLDGTLDPARRRRLDEHLESCGDCSDEFEGLEATVALLRALPEPEAPENLAESVLRRIAAGEAEPGFRLRLDRRLGALATALSSPRLALPVAAALAIVAVVGFGLADLAIGTGAQHHRRLATAMTDRLDLNQVVRPGQQLFTSFK